MKVSFSTLLERWHYHMYIKGSIWRHFARACTVKLQCTSALAFTKAWPHKAFHFKAPDRYCVMERNIPACNFKTLLTCFSTRCAYGSCSFLGDKFRAIYEWAFCHDCHVTNTGESHRFWEQLRIMLPKLTLYSLPQFGITTILSATPIHQI